jgi:hypothetical protein
MKWLPGLFVILAVSSAPAGDAAFAPDGKSVHFLSGHPAKLWTVNLADGKLSDTDFFK